jgi:hypothetical protein
MGCVITLAHCNIRLAAEFVDPRRCCGWRTCSSSADDQRALSPRNAAPDALTHASRRAMQVGTTTTHIGAKVLRMRS